MFSTSLFIFKSTIHIITKKVNALIFCGICATLLGEEFDLDGNHETNITWIYAILILAAGDLCGAFLSPQDGGLITHTFVGSILYIWFFLIFVLICGGFMCCGFYVASGGENASYTSNPSWGRIILSHALCIIIMWCFLLYYIVVNTSMIKFYKGEHYIDAWTETWTEREYDAYLDLIEGNWEQQFNFYFMLLSIGG